MNRPSFEEFETLKFHREQIFLQEMIRNDERIGKTREKIHDSPGIALKARNLPLRKHISRPSGSKEA